MNKYAQIKIKSFADEFEKVGAVATLATTLLTKALPRLLRFAKGSKGITGTAQGFLARAGDKGWSARKTYRRGLVMASRRYGTIGRLPDYRKAKTWAAAQKGKGNLKGVKARPMLGIKERAAQFANPSLNKGIAYPKFLSSANPFNNKSKFTDWIKTRPAEWTGQIAQNMRQVQGIGLGGFIKSDFIKAKYFDAGKGFMHRRSLTGRVLNPTLTSGVGMGGTMYALNKTNPVTGQPRGQARRVAGGLADAAAWSIAPSVAGVAILGSMVPDAIKGIKGLAKRRPTSNIGNYSFNN